MKQRLITLVLATLVLGSTTSIAMADTTEDSVSLTCFPHGSGETEYVSSWGAPRSGGRGHTGTDLMSPRGLEVVAAADGYVETLRNGNRSGYYIRLSHDDGAWETWYMHLNNDSPGSDDGRGGAEAAYAQGLAVGDFVKAGQVIGYVGDSGNAEWTSPHTHFELHIDDHKVDPYPYLVAVDERVTETYEMLDAVAASTDVGPNQADHGTLWGWLVESGADGCLSSGYKDLVEHLFGELPSEGVLLTGVEAR